MSQQLLTILNYIWVFIKLLLFCAIISLPFIGITYLLQKKFEWLRVKKKLSYALSLFIIIFVISYVILLLIFFISSLGKFSTFYFGESLLFILIQTIRLFLVNLLFTGMLFIIAMFIALLYDSFVNKKDKKIKTRTKKTRGLAFFNLWKAFTMVFFVVFLFIIIIFPKIIAIILFLIYM